MVNRQTIFDLQQKAPTKGGLFFQNGWRSVESGRMTDECNEKHKELVRMRVLAGRFEKD